MTGLSALPLGQEQGHEGHLQNFRGVARILGPRWAHLPTITIGLLGVQIFWSVEMSYASPYLLSLGLSKSSMAIVFVAGPLSGLIMQPLIGTLADNSTSRFGRRRPYMLLGTIVCMVAMLLLGFTRPVAALFTSDTSSNNILSIFLAVLSIYLIDFSINAVQAVDRALLVDTLPPSRQASGNAWAARMLGVGSVVGFYIGNINLPRILPFLGKTQLEGLSVVVSLLLLVGHLVMAILVKERVLCTKSQGKSFIQEIKDIWRNMRTLPHVIRQICLIQFFAWIAWFPVLFYSTLYIGDLYKRSASVPTSDEEQLLLDAEATRLGSRALFFSSILSLLVNVTLPAFVSESSSTNENSGCDRICRVPKWLHIHMATLWAVSHFIFAVCMLATFFTHSVMGSTLIITVTGFSWAVTQWAPFSLLAEAILTGCAPQEEAIAIRLSDTRSPRPQTVDDHEREFLVSGRDSDEEDDDDDDEEEAKRQERSRILTQSGAQVSRIDLTELDEDNGYEVVHRGNGRQSRESMRPLATSGRHEQDEATLSSKAGIILGIHNIFVVIPQFLVTGFAALLFAILDPEKPVLPGHRPPVAPHPGPATNVTLGLSKNITDSLIRVSGHVLRTEIEDASHSNSVVYIFRVGGVAASFAFVLCLRLARELRHR